MLSYEAPAMGGAPMGQMQGLAPAQLGVGGAHPGPSGPQHRPANVPANGQVQSWRRAFAVLQAVGRSASDLVADSTEWKKLDKTARMLHGLSHAARQSPIVLLHHMLSDHIRGLRQFDLGLRGQALGGAGQTPIHAVGFQNDDTLAIYICKPSRDPFFLDLAPLVSHYTRVRCRVLSHAGDRIGPAGRLLARDEAELFDDMFLDVDLEPHEIMEFCMYFPTFT